MTNNRFFNVRNILSVISILVANQLFSQTLSSNPTSIDLGNVVVNQSGGPINYTLTWAGFSNPVSITSSDANLQFDVFGGSSPQSSINASPSPASAVIEVYALSNTADGAHSSTITHTYLSNLLNLTATYNIIATEPTTASSGLSFSGIGANGITLNFTAGNGGKRLVIVRADNAVNFTPNDGEILSGANTNFSLATDLGNGNKLVYSGNGNSVAINGLQHNTTYYVAVIEFNEGTGTSQNYLTSSTLTGLQATNATAAFNTTNTATSLDNDFNDINTTYTSSALPNGWYMNETNGNANYDITDGSATTGGVYSAGITSSGDRALGSLNAGTNTQNIIAFRIENSATEDIKGFLIEFTGEQWRLGATGRTDKLDFQYSTNATAPNNGTWTDVNELDFTAPVTTGSIGALNGNDVANRTKITGIIDYSTGLFQYGTIWFRWVDSDATGDDDLLAIDDVAIIPFTNTSTTTTQNVNTSTIDNYLLIDNVTMQTNVTVNGGVFAMPGKKINLNGNKLTLNGRVYGTPVFTTSNTSDELELTGTEIVADLQFDQTTPGTTNTLSALTINKPGRTVALNNALLIKDNGTVTVTNGTLSSGGNLTLTSSVSSSARIAELPAGASVTGNVNVQRWMNGGTALKPASTTPQARTWRTMASPVQGGTYQQFSDDIFVTGPGGAASGFDGTSATSSSILTYSEIAPRGWTNITNITNSLPSSGKGMLVFYRGTRNQPTSIGNTTVAPRDTVITFTGTINSGSIPVSLDYTNTSSPIDDGWNLVGNPFPSQINWDNVTKQGSVSSFFYVYDPTNSNYYSDNTGIIPASQGFFVQTAASGASLTFEENDKSATSGTAYFKTSTTTILNVKMAIDSTQFDAGSIRFKSGASKNYVFGEDATKFMNAGYNLIFLTADNISTQHNVVNILNTNASDTFTVGVTSSQSRSYTLMFSNLSQVPSTKNIYLKDRFTNSWQDLRVNPNYVFSVSTSNASTTGNRFDVIITDQFNPLPVKLTRFIGKKVNTSNVLSWTSQGEKNILNYEVQRSEDGKNFSSISTLKAINSATENTYTYTDEHVKGGTQFYRLKINESNQISYSHILSLSDVTNTAFNIEAYPNPVSNALNLVLPKQYNELTIEIVNLQGVTLQKTILTSNQIDLSNLDRGVYFIKVNLEDTTQLLKVVKQ